MRSSGASAGSGVMSYALRDFFDVYASLVTLCRCRTSVNSCVLVHVPREGLEAGCVYCRHFSSLWVKSPVYSEAGVKDEDEEDRLRALGWAIQKESSDHAAMIVEGDLEMVVMLQVGSHARLAVDGIISHTPLSVPVMRRFLVWPAPVTCFGLDVTRHRGEVGDRPVVQIPELQCFVFNAAAIVDRLLFWQLPCCSDV